MLAHQVHVWTERHARQLALAALILAHAYPDTQEIIAKYVTLNVWIFKFQYLKYYMEILIKRQCML
jgi:hypothetical protein